MKFDVEEHTIITLEPCAVERDVRSGRGSESSSSLGPVRRVRLPKVIVSKNNSYEHDDQGDNPGQATEGSTVSSINCDRCWHLDYQRQGVSRADVCRRCGWDRWLTLNNRRQSVRPKPDSRPRLEGARQK